jgi:Kef-type K+ transport system membrane component KefB
MEQPRASELTAFACVCALLLFVPSTPLVEHAARFANNRGLSEAQTASFLIACVFASLAVVAASVAASFAAFRMVQR